METIKLMLSTDTPNNVNKYFCVCMHSCICVLLIILCYGIGFSIVVGIMFIEHPGYDFMTGCQINVIECAYPNRMMCNAKELHICFLFAGPTSVIVPVIIIVILSLINSLKNMWSDCLISYHTANNIIIQQKYSESNDGLDSIYESDSNIINLDESTKLSKH